MPDDEPPLLPDPESVPCTRDELAALVRAHCEWISGCLAEPRDGWCPHLVVVCRNFVVLGGDGKDEVTLCALNVPLNEAEEKQAIMRGIGRKFYNDRKIVAGIVFSAEAWLSTKKPGEPYVEPRLDPGRKEAIVVTALAMGDRHPMMRTMVIGRDADNNIIPGPWSPEDENADVTNPILRHFYFGYAAAVLRMMRDEDAPPNRPAARPTD
jgi:hypothetical protein